MAITRRQGTGHASAGARLEVRPSAASDVAWIAVGPCAIVLLAVVVVLGPSLGALLFPRLSVTWWPNSLAAVKPEPTEQARYLLALLGPVLVSGVVLRARSRARLSALPARAAVWASQALALAFLLLCVVRQHTVAFGEPYYQDHPMHRVYFTWTTLAVAVVLAALLAALLRSRAAIASLSAWTRERTTIRLAVALLALLLTATWLLTAFNTEGSIGNAHFAVRLNMPFWLDETYAVLNGRAPFVNFNSQYGQLWPYLAAGVMSIAGTSMGVYAAIMTLGAGASLLAIFALVRRIVQRSLVALALYVPFLATGFFMELGPLANRYGPSNLFSLFPMRYGGPYLLAWLTARHVDRLRPHRLWLIFTFGGLVAINNVEFGLPAFGATLVAVIWTDPQPSWRRAGRLTGDAAIGLTGAAALVTLLALVVGGALPHPGMLFTFSKLWGVGGFTMLPLPELGFHVVMYVTLAAALVVASVRAVTRHEGTVLTAMLAWVGMFGLGSGIYFVGRSHPEVLVDMFSVWALAVVLLLVVVVQAILARPSRRPALAELAVLAAFGILVCSLPQTPTPWSQIDRIGRETPTPTLTSPLDKAFIARATKPGESVVILASLGHRTAYELGLTNVAPYVSLQSMPTRDQMTETLRALRDAHGRLLFLPLGFAQPAVLDDLQRSGFRYVEQQEQTGLAEFADTR